MQKTLDRFLVFYDEYYDKVHKHIFYNTGCNKDIADDLTAEVFMKALEKLHQYREESLMKTWVYQIVRNHVIDYYRTRKKTVSLDSVGEIPSSGDMRETIAVKDAAEQVVHTMHRLPRRYREILTLKYIDQMETNEIAEVMNIPKSRVYVVLSRATQKLQSLMQ